MYINNKSLLSPNKFLKFTFLYRNEHNLRMTESWQNGLWNIRPPTVQT